MLSNFTYSFFLFLSIILCANTDENVIPPKKLHNFETTKRKILENHDFQVIVGQRWVMIFYFDGLCVSKYRKRRSLPNKEDVSRGCRNRPPEMFVQPVKRNEMYKMHF